MKNEDKKKETNNGNNGEVVLDRKFMDHVVILLDKGTTNFDDTPYSTWLTARGYSNSCQ
jgi:hypothetical protein